jgi:hypothetical protein
MSINPLLTNYGPGASLYAPASGGGGGGGGLGDNPVVSSITFNGQATSKDITFPNGYLANCRVDVLQLNGPSTLTLTLDTVGAQTVTSNAGIIIGNKNSAANIQITQGAIAEITIGGTPGNYLSIDTCIPDMYRAQFLDAGVPLAFSNPLVGQLTATAVGGMNVLDAAGAGWVMNMSSLNVSSINGAVPGGGSANPNPSFSTVQMNGAISMNNNSLEMNSAGGAVQYYNAVDSNLYLQGLSSAQVVLGVQGAATQLQVGATSINMPTAVYMNQSQTANATISSLNVSSINSLQPIGTFAGAMMAGGFQCGYANNVPYAGDITFPHPYPDDKVCVMMTPTNAGVSGGANPNLSLNAAYGNNGVSSIGFATDFRNAGIGATGSFYWMAFPWTI